MKKLIVLLVSVFIIQQANAQSFQKGSLVISANWGIDVNHLQEQQINKYTNKTIDTTGGAASTNFNIGAEYGILNWLGLGLQFKLDQYLHDTNVSSATGFELGVIANIHIVRSQHFNLVAGIDLGFSNLTINLNTGNYQIYGSGSWGDIHITPRYYFGRLGINLNLYFPFINYPSLTTNVAQYNEYVTNSWKASGVGFTAGLQYRIL